MISTVAWLKSHYIEFPRSSESMSKSPDRSGSAFNPKAWIVPAVVTCTLVAAVVSYTRSAEIHAAAGSPYYSKAVQEALAGLQNSGEKEAIPTVPALPAGLSPAEHYWCEQCKTYHKRQPAGAAAGGTPAPVPAPAAGGAPVPAPAAGVSPVPVAGAAAAVPALPQGLSPADYYWCANCKVYHSRANPKVNVAGVVDPAKAAAQPPQSEIPPSLVRPNTPPEQK